MKVYELAKKLKIPNKELIAKLRAAGIEVTSHLNAIDEKAVQKIADKLTPAQPAEQAPTAAPEKPAEQAPTAAPEKPVGQAPTAAPEKPVGQAPTAAPEKPVEQAPTVAPEKPVTKATAPKPTPQASDDPAGKRVITMHGAITVRNLAEQLQIKPNQLITELMAMNVFASINERLDLKVAQHIAEKHNVILEHAKKTVLQKTPARKSEDEEEEPDDRPEDQVPRPPVVTFLGHIDHGKTSLLDRIRNTAVAKKEAGGITQHIGAYTIEYNGHKITFLDTPGHAAFTAMRARGANVTDIAVIVIAANDGIMPQTEEAIQHAQAAETTIMIAINKIDLPDANLDRVKKQLQAKGLSPEDWGGNIICCPVSALNGEGMEHLLAMILLNAEMLEMKCNPKARCTGYVLEARLEPGMGPMATLLPRKGTLHVGDIIACGPYWGRVRALINDHGIKVRTAMVATPVQCLGLSGVPQAGALFKTYTSDKIARAISEERGIELRTNKLTMPKRVSLEDFLAETGQDTPLELKLVLKCDTQGSLEAIQNAIEQIKSEKISSSIVLAGVGNINENDVLLASASKAIIIGFNISREPNVAQTEKEEGVELRLYSVIYQILDDIKAVMTSMLQPAIREKFLGRAEVRQVFSITKKGNIAGCLLVEGRITARCKARVKRQNSVLYEGSITTLKRFQSTVGEVMEGQECGIRLDNFTDFAEQDIIEFYDLEKVTQTL